MMKPRWQSAVYKETREIDDAEIRILKLCKTAAEMRYSKERFKREIDGIINETCATMRSDDLKKRTREALRIYAQKCFVKELKLIENAVLYYAILTIGARQGRRDAIKEKQGFEKSTSKSFRLSPGFLDRLNKELPDTAYPSRLPLDEYHKTYMERIKRLTTELVESGAKEDYTTNVSLRNIAEMTVRYENQLEMIEKKRRNGTKLVYILPHPNCSERCQKYQVGGTKHSSGLYSLDGSSGVTEDGIKYLPLEFATNNPDDLYTTRAGKTYQNGCLTGFNCRHKLGDYIPGVKPEPIPDEVIERRRNIEQKQREYERDIRKYTKAAIVTSEINPKQSRMFKDAALEKTEKYKEFSQKNGVAFFPERTKLYADDGQNELTPTEKSAILYMNNRDVRKWYDKEVSKIGEYDNPSLPLRERAQIAFNRRSQLRFEAREKMADFDTRNILDKKRPPTFDEFVEGKMEQMGLTKEEAYLYLLGSAKRTNANVNKELRIGKK